VQQHSDLLGRPGHHGVTLGKKVGVPKHVVGVSKQELESASNLWMLMNTKKDVMEWMPRIPNNFQNKRETATYLVVQRTVPGQCGEDGQDAHSHAVKEKQNETDTAYRLQTEERNAHQNLIRTIKCPICMKKQSNAQWRTVKYSIGANGAPGLNAVAHVAGDHDQGRGNA